MQDPSNDMQHHMGMVAMGDGSGNGGGSGGNGGGDGGVPGNDGAGIGAVGDGIDAEPVGSGSGGGGGGGDLRGGERGGSPRRSTVGPRDYTVAKTTNFKSLAAKLAGEARKGSMQGLRAMGAHNINTVVKGFALARRYTEEQHIDMNCQVRFIEVPAFGGISDGEVAPGGDTRTAIRFTFNRTPLRSQEHRRADVEFKVGASSATKSVAGAIAKHVRMFENIALLAVGPNSVNQCIKAICIACRYCEENNLSMSFRPRFTTIAHDNSESISGLRFTLYISQI